MYTLTFSHMAQKDVRKIKAAKLQGKCEQLLDLIAQNPYQAPPSYEKLSGRLQHCYARRINLQHRLVYEVLEAEKEVYILRMWTHYDWV